MDATAKETTGDGIAMVVTREKSEKKRATTRLRVSFFCFSR